MIIGIIILLYVVMNGSVVLWNEESLFISNFCLIFSLIIKKKIVIRLLLMNLIIVRLCFVCESKLKFLMWKWSLCDKNFWYIDVVGELVIIVVVIVVINNRIFVVIFIDEKFFIECKIVIIGIYNIRFK